MNEKLVKLIQDELEEDCERFDIGSEEDLESWVENCLDCPSDTLTEYLSQIPEEESEEYYNMIDEKLASIVERMLESFYN